METVLVIGASGNIGVAAIIAALRSGRRVLAPVRNQASADKLFKHVGKKEGITTVEANILSEDGVQKVVDQVEAGKLPAFQHVYSTAGLWESTGLTDLSTAAFRHVMNVNLESHFFAYRATIPYLIKQGSPNASWTLMTGAAGDFGAGGVTAVSQGALFSLANAASRELKGTNVRFNENYLAIRVDYDSVAEEKGEGKSMKASTFSRVYEAILANKDINASRVSVNKPEDVDTLQHKKKL